ncbi:MAG TPA: NAD(+) diphosphatase [Salinarimonas sp.]|jgi:NAD+ diphosphatase|nr:NAD(+) diphosphatase [Salinarimonas sp.]
MPPPLGFVTNPLDRQSAERPGLSLDAVKADPRARAVLIAGEVPILAEAAGGPTALLPVAALDRAGALKEHAILGLLAGAPVLAVLAAPEAAEAYRDDPAFRVQDLRSLAMGSVLPPEELGILAEAKALMHWHDRHRFCANCGTPTAPTAGGFRRDCGACGVQHFPRTDPVVIMLIAHGEHILLGRQSRFPPGMYSCLAGFVEPGETIEDAVRRETFEEAGVRVGAVRYAASQPWPFPMSLMIGCIGEALTDELVVDREELEEVRWVPRDEVVLMMERRHPEGITGPNPIAIAHHLVRTWLGA